MNFNENWEPMLSCKITIVMVEDLYWVLAGGQTRNLRGQGILSFFWALFHDRFSLSAAGGETGLLLKGQSLESQGLTQPGWNASGLEQGEKT